MADTNAERVKERTDIVALIGEQVRLKKAGSNFKGLCPFHSEKTPSFVVSPSRQMFYCFGCNESGDVFSWLMKREGMTFPEALRVLAQRAGIQLTFEHAERREERERLRATLDTVVGFYHTVLLKTAEGREAHQYLQSRGISEESITSWRLGFVPRSGTPLIEKAKERGVTSNDLLKAGILAQRPSGNYERFSGRILFPLADTHGSVVGLAGRILKEDPNKAPVAKYVNTPETTLYTKSKLLYGLDKARDAIRQKSFVVVVEGYTDVIASHQAGISYVVATSGTAFTSDHVQVLKRFTENIAFAFDADAAGDKATRRALDQALAAGCNVSVVLLPPEKDPADLAVNSKEKWEQVIRDRVDAFSFLLKRAVSQHRPTDAASKKAVATELFPLLARIPDAVVRGEYIQQLAAELDLEPRYLYEDLERVRGRSSAPERPSPTESSLPSGKPEAVRDPHVLREERLLALLLVSPATFPAAAEHLHPEFFTGSHTRHLYKELCRWYDGRHAAGEPLDFSEVQQNLPEDLRRLVEQYQLTIEVEQEEGLLTHPDRDARTLIRDLLVSYLRQRLQEMTRELETTAASAHPQLLREIAKLTQELAHAEQLTI